MIDRVENPNPVRFRGLIPGEYFGLFIHEVPYDPTSPRLPDKVRRCQRLPGSGYRYRLAGANELQHGNGKTGPLLTGDTLVHGYGDDELTELNERTEARRDRAALREAARAVHHLGRPEYWSETVLLDLADAALRRVALRVLRRLRLAADPDLRFVRLHRYRPLYDPQFDPDHSLRHVQALELGLEHWVSCVGRKRLYSSTEPEVEARLAELDGTEVLAPLGIYRAQLASALDELEQTDERYRALQGAIDQILRAYSRLADEPTTTA